MTHAESHELLLDLAFGELDAARAAEVEQHVQGCDECRREKEALDEARRMTAPMRALDEPSADFDARIMEAAKTQAQLTHEGNIGQVIEVAGSVKPLGLTPSNIDAHGPVAVRPERRKPRWMLRVALGGSVAAAAALALVMSTTLQNKRAAEAVEKTAAYEIRIQPVDATAKKVATVTQSIPRQPESAPAAAPPPVVDAKEKDKAPALEHARRAAKKAERRDDDLALGSGGDTGPAPIAVDFGGGGGVSSNAAGAGQKAAEAELDQPAPPPPAAPSPPAMRLQAPAKQMPAPMAQAPMREAAPPKNEPAALGVLAARPGAAVASAGNADAESPDSLEQRAENARHAGNFALAAGLYRRAADLHRSEATPNNSTAAWDLAHAVECLANIGQFEEAKKVRDELIRLYPSEDAPFSAASRALREVDSAPPASDAVKR